MQAQTQDKLSPNPWGFKQMLVVKLRLKCLDMNPYIKGLKQLKQNSLDFE